VIRWATNLIGAAGAPMAAKVAIGMGVLIATLGLALGLLLWRYNAAQQQIGASAQQIAQCRADNQVQTAHLRELGLEINRITGEIEVQRDALQAAELNAERLARERQRAASAESNARAEIYRRQPDCETWALGMVCADIAERMRQRRSALIGRWSEHSDG